MTSTQLLLTAAYSHQFELPITLFQFWQRQLSLPLDESFQRGASDPDYDVKWLDSVLVPVWDQDGRSNLVRWQRLKASQLLISRATVLKVFLRSVPWIEGVFITGSTAMNNAMPTDDLDLMIVTKPNRLWLTRMLVVLVSSVLGKRRAWQADRERANGEHRAHGRSAGEWCFNLWLASDSLQVPFTSRTVYTAYELTQAQAWWPTHLTDTIRRQNRWVNQVLPQADWNVMSNQPRPVSWKDWVDWLGAGLWWSLDWIAYVIQYWYMKPHMTTERVSKKFAFFHPRETKKILYEGWSKSSMLLGDEWLNSRYFSESENVES